MRGTATPALPVTRPGQATGRPRRSRGRRFHRGSGYQRRRLPRCPGRPHSASPRRPSWPLRLIQPACAAGRPRVPRLRPWLSLFRWLSLGRPLSQRRPPCHRSVIRLGVTRLAPRRGRCGLDGPVHQPRGGRAHRRPGPRRPGRCDRPSQPVSRDSPRRGPWSAPQRRPSLAPLRRPACPRGRPPPRRPDPTLPRNCRSPHHRLPGRPRPGRPRPGRPRSRTTSGARSPTPPCPPPRRPGRPRSQLIRGRHRPQRRPRRPRFQLTRGRHRPRPRRRPASRCGPR